MRVGMMLSQLTLNPSKIQSFISASDAHTIRLMFPNLDFNQAYPTQEEKADWEKFVTSVWDSNLVQIYQGNKQGTLAPHCLLAQPLQLRVSQGSEEGQLISIISLRQVMSHLCL
mmetsp:Transcript_15411/g.26052  ORF Transcript_15411/g.26052 Transcript_15411/m.26052 type:complete len:114 (-) Transcript_15411:312-653(-)